MRLRYWVMTHGMAATTHRIILSLVVAQTLSVLAIKSLPAELLCNGEGKTDNTKVIGQAVDFSLPSRLRSLQGHSLLLWSRLRIVPVTRVHLLQGTTA